MAWRSVGARGGGRRRQAVAAGVLVTLVALWGSLVAPSATDSDLELWSQVLLQDYNESNAGAVAEGVPAGAAAVQDEGTLGALTAWPDDYEDEDAYDATLDAEEAHAMPNVTGLCNGWCGRQLLDLVDCEKKGLDRLRLAFQIENCEAALQKGNRALVAHKIRKVSESSAFIFFRGAAAFFDYNMMCDDKNFTFKKLNMPRVYSNGDCHPENFGVMVQASNNVEPSASTGDLVWGVNDFDQSFLTPFSWDLKRGATGFALGIKDRGWPLRDVANASRTFIEAYLDTVMARKDCAYLNDERFQEGASYVKKHAPVIGKLFAKARSKDSAKDSAKFLEKKMSINLKKKHFVLDRDRGIFPMPPSTLPKFQAAIDAWMYHGVGALAKYPNIKDFYKVLAAARKEGSGTGSIGLKRYYVLIKGRYDEPHGNIVLELKQEVNSVLEVFFRYSYTKSQEGKRAVDAEHSAWPYANLFYGWTTLDGEPFMVREKSKHLVGADIEELTKDEYMEYAAHSGRALAFYHIRVRCPNHECVLKEKSAVDVEICHNIQRYLTNYDVGAFARMVYAFAQKEFNRQNNAFELLSRFVARRSSHGGSPIDLLRGGERPAVCEGSPPGLEED